MNTRTENQKVKVLIVVCGVSLEGIGTFVLNLFEHMDPEKVEIVFAVATKYKQFYEDRLINGGAKFIRTYEMGDGLVGIIKHFINLLRVIKREGPFDVLHTHMDFFNGINLIAGFLAGVPSRISHSHMSCGIGFLSPKKRLTNYFMRALIRVFSNRKLGCSVDANSYINGVKKTIVNVNEVINDGLDIKKFQKQINSKKEYNLSRNNERINFITIGRIVDEKKPLFIVEIMNELKKNKMNFHLSWVGTGALEKEVRSLIQEYKLHDNVSMLGSRSDIPELLDKVDFMILPSKWEGLGIVLIEAQASRVPCFISDTIPKEADVGLCTRIPINKTAKEWAKQITDHIYNNTFNNCLDGKLLDSFEIQEVAKKMEQIYCYKNN